MLLGQQVELIDSIINKIYGHVPDHIVGDDEEIIFAIPGEDSQENKEKFDQYVEMVVKNKRKNIIIRFDG